MSRRKVFDGRLIKVYTSKKRLPNGREAYFEEVRHPGASLIVPLFKKKIVFIRQYRGVIGRYIWELPAGTLAPGETPYSCAKREVTEETGFLVKDLRKIGIIYTTPGFCNEAIHIYKARCDARKACKLGHDELIRVRLMSRTKVRSLFRKGRINDSKTVAALCFAGIL